MDDGHKRQQFLELGQEIQPQFALGQDVVQDQEVRSVLGDFGQGFAAVGDTDQRVLRQRLLVYLILEVVVFDDQEGRGGQVRLDYAPAG